MKYLIVSMLTVSLVMGVCLLGEAAYMGITGVDAFDDLRATMALVLGMFFLMPPFAMWCDYKRFCQEEGQK
tara:strand:+ start:431 stop:643 length:213 start_codon:yes stop_codon:yes gene_type:complete